MSPETFYDSDPLKNQCDELLNMSFFLDLFPLSPYLQV